MLSQTIITMKKTKLTLSQIKQRYDEFCENFDPSPYYADDGYASLPDFDTWFELDNGFGAVIEEEGLDPKDYEILPTE